MKSRVFRIPVGLTAAILLSYVWVAASAATASPSIVWSGTMDQTIGLGPGQTITPFHLDSNGIVDFNFRMQEAALYFSPVGNNASVVDLMSLRPLPADTWIGQTLVSPYAWDGNEHMLVAYLAIEPPGGDGGSGPWHGVERGLMGLSFEIDGQTHYGWARMSDVSSTHAVLHDWAYETQPGMGLYAGAVPEPTTLALFAFGIGTLGLASWHRRRHNL